MEKRTHWTVKEFAQVSRITAATLRYYDKIGLLSPLSRGENNDYRYYHGRRSPVLISFVPARN
ncbi:MAG: MerR family DNA-binding transcriptional regulator [Dehalococcoidia bacterium]|nr:MerR family DNA-binding transcriptional regulator [Dehalococcoidia bacterium]